MSVITISSSFGAGGSVVAEQVGSMLGWKVINRAIPAEVALQLSVPMEVALAHDEESGDRFWRALVRSATQLAAEGGADLPPEIFTGEHAFRSITETIIRNIAESSDCVIVGRAASIILKDRTDVFSVRLDGPVSARIQQAMLALDLTQGEAKRKLEHTDRARKEYIRHFYRQHWADPMLYHLLIDSTAVPLEVCAQLVVIAAYAYGASPQNRHALIPRFHGIDE